MAVVDHEYWLIALSISSQHDWIHRLNSSAIRDATVRPKLRVLRIHVSDLRNSLRQPRFCLWHCQGRSGYLVDGCHET